MDSFVQQRYCDDQEDRSDERAAGERREGGERQEGEHGDVSQDFPWSAGNDVARARNCTQYEK